MVYDFTIRFPDVWCDHVYAVWQLFFLFIRSLTPAEQGLFCFWPQCGVV